MKLQNYDYNVLEGCHKVNKCKKHDLQIVRSHDKTKHNILLTQVYCKITCTHGLNEGAVDINFILNGDGRSFNLTCDKSISEWTYDVNKICKSVKIRIF